jgi:hypothetical protein
LYLIVEHNNLVAKEMTIQYKALNPETSEYEVVFEDTEANKDSYYDLVKIEGEED